MAEARKLELLSSPVALMAVVAIPSALLGAPSSLVPASAVLPDREEGLGALAVAAGLWMAEVT